MNNINFDNPWILLVGILLLALIVAAFIITIKKENKTKNNITSFILHIIIVVLLTLAFAKTTYETVITETNIYVLADVSYSSNKNLDLIDQYINDLQKTSPKNTKIGIVCFGKNYQLLNKPGDNIKSVKEATVDNSATDIASALEYTGTLFKDNVIKRIVIISDGKETTQSNIVTIVQNLSLDNIYIDAIYLDNNLKEEDNEVQISEVDCVSSTYLDIDEKAYILVQANKNSKGYLKLYCDDELYDERAVALNVGFNTISFNLNTTVSGNHQYKVVVETDNDTSEYNNVYYFSQEVVDKVKVLFISSSEDDKQKAIDLYGETASIDFYINDPEIPYTVEELCIYDEFILSNIDMRTINNASKFISSVDTLVSEFGKSLTTFGNTYIQNNEDDQILSSLSDMLPVKFGNGENDEKLVTLVIDISRSMEQASKFHIAKECASVILDNLQDEVKVMVYVFYGNNYMAVKPTPAADRESIKEQIQNLSAFQGTIMGGALREVYQAISSFAYSKNEVVLISDGLPYGEDEEAARNYANKLALANAVISTIHVVAEEGTKLMNDIAKIGRGYYYYIKYLDSVKSLILDEVLNTLNEVVLEGSESPVNIVLTKDKLVSGINELPSVYGLYNNQKKTGTKVVMSATYTDVREFEYEIPLYSYWEYGNGRVSSFASSFTGEWIKNWENNSESNKLFMNSFDVNRPVQRIDSAFYVSHLSDNVATEITVTAPTINKDSNMQATIIFPDGTTEVKDLIFNGQNYLFNIPSEMTGEYNITINYTYQELSYSTNYKFTISYLPEYNSFTIFEASNLYYMVSNNGQISENGKLNIENDNSIIQKYIIDFTPILTLISCCLFIIDIIVRKLRWADIKSLFRFKKNQQSNNKRRSN